MDDAERNRRFRGERGRRARARTRIQRDTMGEIRRLLREADERILAVLAGTPTDFETFLLPQQQAAIRRALDEIGDRASQALATGAGEEWRAGVALVDAPIEAGGVRLAGVIPEIDTRQLAAMRTFMTDRMRDVTTQIANRVNADLGLVAIGSQTTGEAVGNVARHLRSGRGRAVTIVRTELGRAFSTATQERLEAAREVLPGLRKQWRRSGRLDPRPHHQAIDGQVREVDKPFVLANGVKLMFPRDPRAPAAETINCGDESLPFVESWEVRSPGAVPVSDEERRRRRLAQARRAA